MRGTLPIFRPWSEPKTPAHPEYRRYLDRNCIKHLFGKLKQKRRIAPGRDKTALSPEDFLHLAAKRR